MNLVDQVCVRVLRLPTDIHPFEFCEGEFATFVVQVKVADGGVSDALMSEQGADGFAQSIFAVVACTTEEQCSHFPSPVLADAVEVKASSDGFEEDFSACWIEAFQEAIALL